MCGVIIRAKDELKKNGMLKKMELTLVKKLTKDRKSQSVYAMIAFLLGIAPLASGVMPFGCAFLCAVPKKARKSAFFGVLASSVFDPCIPLALFCAVYLFLILALKEKHGGIFTYTRLLLSFSLSAFRAAYIAVTGVNGTQDMLRLFAAVVAYPAFTFAFSGFFDKKKDLHPKRYDLSLLAFAFSLTLLFSGLKLFGVSLALMLGAAFALCAARTRGFAFGGVCGVICGLVSGGAATGALGVLGMTYGLLVNEIEPLALLLSFMIAVSGYFYLDGTESTVVAGLMLFAVYAVFFPFRKRVPIHKTAAASIEKRAHDRRISRYAAAFSSLSSVFYTVSDTTREESITDLNQKIVRAVESHCERCDGCELDKSEISNFFTSELRRNGVASYSRIPTHISARCPNACSIAREVNNLRNLREKDGEKGLKQMADEYSAFSSILIDAAKKQDENSKTDKLLAEKVKNSLRETGVLCDGVRVVGTRLREITAYGVKPENITSSPESISSAVAKAIGTAVSPPELLLHDDYTLMRFQTIPSFRVECAKISEAKTGESVCGDTVSVFENDERYFYCLVSDGMGSGRDAALTSRLSAIMLEKLLTVGAEKESALKLLNKALVEKEEEVFATVDLLEIDRVLSTATLIKAGAAPTLFIRGGYSTRIESRTPPAGIMRNVIAEKKTFKLEKGDMIVMLSDGILQTGSDFVILPESGLPPMPSARALASKILREARRNCETADDMSVCVLRIC